MHSIPVNAFDTFVDPPHVLKTLPEIRLNTKRPKTDYLYVAMEICANLERPPCTPAAPLRNAPGLPKRPGLRDVPAGN